MSKPYVALVGRPNTGKSTLFNRMAGKRISIVEDTPGVTRDRIIAEAEWCGTSFYVIDTGGIEPDSVEPIPAQMRRQAQAAMDMADVIIFIVDAKTGATASDREIAAMIRKKSADVILAVNKIDSPDKAPLLYEFYELGLGEPMQLSAEHGLGLGDILDKALSMFPTESLGQSADECSRIAVVGRPNAGKSTLINSLLGEQRVIVSEIAGTTRDAVDTDFSYDGQSYVLIDTAGIRKKGKNSPAIEYYSMLRALKAIERSEICLLVIDAVAGVTDQDVKIAGMIKEAYKAIVIVMNKWDLVEKETNTMVHMQKDIMSKLHFVGYAETVFLSAVDSGRMNRLMPAVEKALAEYAKRITTGLLNDALGDAVLTNSPPVKKGKQLKIFYMNQVSAKPPTFVMFVNDDALMTTQYEKYLEGKLRTAFGFNGTPVKFIYRNKGAADKNKA